MASGVVGGVSGPWPIEDHIPDEDSLFMRVHKEDIDDDGPPEPRVFRNHLDEYGTAAMSTDWNKYCDPESTQQRARRRPPADHGVISLRVRTVRTIPGHVVLHAPVFRDPEDPLDPNDRGHSGREEFLASLRALP